KAAASISGEIRREGLLSELLRTVLAIGGADRGVVLLPADTGLRAVAAGVAASDGFHLVMEPAATPPPVPMSMVDAAVRSRDAMVLGDANRDHPHLADPYFRDHSPRSVLCLPLLRQGRA